jgi:hypothetical protein
MQSRKIQSSKVEFCDILFLTGLRPERFHLLRAGTFATVTLTSRKYLLPRVFYSCRESFGRHFGRIKRFLFCHKGCGLEIATFLNCVERKLKLDKQGFEFSRCGPTQHCKVMWIEPSKWWSMNSMRQSFLTAVLRAGQSYNISLGNFESALWSDRYLRQSKYAVTRFLDGYTHYTGMLEGWNNQFFWGDGWGKPIPPTPQEVDRLLVKPVFDEPDEFLES